MAWGPRKAVTGSPPRQDLLRGLCAEPLSPPPSNTRQCSSVREHIPLLIAKEGPATNDVGGQQKSFRPPRWLVTPSLVAIPASGLPLLRISRGDEQDITDLCSYTEDASRPASPTPTAPAKQAAPTPAPTRGTQKPRGGPASRGGRYYQRGGKSAPRDKENADVEDPSAEPKKRGMFPPHPPLALGSDHPIFIRPIPYPLIGYAPNSHWK